MLGVVDRAHMVLLYVVLCVRVGMIVFVKNGGKGLIIEAPLV